MGIVSEMAKSTQATLNANKAMANATKKLRSGEGTKVSLSTKDDVKKKVISDFDPGIFLTSKEEYEEERLRDESLPEFGSYQYFVNLEKSMRPTIASMGTGSDRRGDMTVGWAKQYKENPEALKRQGESIYNEGKRLAKVFDNQEALALKYKEIVDIIDSYETPGIKLDEKGNIDAKEGIKSSEDKGERAKALASAPMPTRTAEEREKLEEDIHFAYENKTAYEQYDKYKDKKYEDTLTGRIAGNFRLGDLGVKSNEAGYIDYAFGSKDGEAVQIYQALMDQIQKNNAKTFVNDTGWEEGLALVSQQAAQQYNRVKEAAPAYLTSFIVPPFLRGGVSAIGSVSFNFRQTAGQQFIELISQDPDISVEDAQKLAKNSGVLSSLVEYGLDSVFDAVAWGIGKGTKSVKPLFTKAKLVNATGDAVKKTLSKIGVSDKAQKSLMKLAGTAGKFAMKTFSEGSEEGIQAMITTSTNRLARKGGGNSWTDIVGEMFNFSEYTDEDWNQIGNDFKAGLIVGGFGEMVKSAAYSVRDASWNKIAKNIDAKETGKKVFSFLDDGILSDEDVENVVYQGMKSDDPRVSKLANKINDTFLKNEKVSNYDMGKLWQDVMQIKTDPTTFSNPDTFTYELEQKLMDRGVSADVRKKTIERVADIELRFGKEQAETYIKTVDRITNEINSSLGDVIQSKVNFTDLFAANMEMAASGSNVMTSQFVEQYADSIVRAIKKKNAPIYNVLTNSKYGEINSDRSLSSALVSFIMEGKEPEGNKMAFRTLADKFKTIVKTASDKLGVEMEVFNSANTDTDSNNNTMNATDDNNVEYSHVYDESKVDPIQQTENVQTPHSAVRSTSADIDTSDDIIHSTPLENGGNTANYADNSPVILTMGDTFKPNALGTLAANGVSSVYDFANEVVEYYNQNGNINPYVSYFKDNGASVISKIKEISEVNRNVNTEQTVSGRTDIHNDNMGRASDARSGEYGEEISGRTGETESQSGSGKTIEERRNRAKELRDTGKTKSGEIRIGDKVYTYKRIPSKYISDDSEVPDIIRQNKSRGLKTVFISGDVVCGDFSASGVHYGDTVYISYDNEQSPTQINDHELVHFSSDTKAYADFKKSVFDKLTEKEKEKLRREISQRYNEAVNEYMNRAYENNPNLSGKEVVDMYNAYLDEEILANLNAGTLTLSVDVSEDIAIFRKAIGGYETSETETTPVDTESKANNSPADYKNEIDAGPRFDISLRDVENVQSIGRKHINEFANEDIEKTLPFARKYFKEMGTKSPFFRAWFGDWRAFDENEISVTGIDNLKNFIATKDTYRGVLKNSDTEWSITVGRQGIDDTISYSRGENISTKTLSEIKKILEAAILLDTETSERTSTKKHKNTLFMHKLYSPIRYGNELFIAKITIEEYFDNKNISRRFYNLHDIKISPESVDFSSEEHPNQRDIPGDTISVSDLYRIVKQYDKDFVANDTVDVAMLNTERTPKILYHQTDNTFTVFNTRHKGAGTRDNETPFGIFMKSTDSDIGVKGKIQMPLYACIRTPFKVENRAELVSKLKELSPEYAELYSKHIELDKEYQTKFDEAKEQWRDYISEWRKSNPDASRKDIYNDARFEELFEAEERVIEEWEKSATELEIQTKEVITKTLKAKGYDGVIIKNDEGSFGRKTDAYIALDNTQVKSATDNIGTFDGTNPDIRFNISSEEPDLKNQHYIEEKAEEIADEDLVKAAKLNTSEVVSMVRRNSDLQKRLTNAKRQMTVSKAKTVNAAEVGKVVKEVISELHGTVDSKVIGPEVMQIYNDYYLDVKKAGRVESKIQIANDKMAERLSHIAEKIVDSSEAMLESEDYGALKSYLRETRIKFPDHAKAEAEFGSFRKSHMGTFNLTNDGVPLDSAYQELCELFPHLFGREVTDPVDQLNLIDETLSKLTPDVYNPHANHAKDATEYAVYRLISALDGISATPDTKADKMYKKSLWEKEQAVEKVKGDYERKLDKLKKDSEEKISKLRKDLSAQRYIRYWETRLSKEEKTETLKRYREKQRVALLKSKIRSVVSDFRAGLNKTEKAGGYPKELVTTVADVCSVLDFHTDRTGENGEPTKVSLKLDALKAEYDNLKDNKAYGEYAEEYSEDLSKDIGDLYKLTKEKRIIDLSVFELENLYNILKEIRHELSIATKQIGLEKSISNMEIGEEIIKTWEEKADLIEKDKAQLLQSLRSADASTRAFVFNPHRINRFIAGYDENSAWWQMYDQLNRGVRKAAKFTSDANKPFDELTSGNGGNEVAFFDFRTKLYDVGLVDKSGRKVTLTKSIMCELLMAWERDQGRVHLQNGGFKIPNISDYNKGHTSKALTEGAVSVEHITQEHINKIKSMLDSYDMEWINKARHLYNVDGKNAINQTSIQLVGREIAKAENYIRLYVDKDFVKTDIEGIKVDASIEGNGSLKSTVQNAKQPIVLRGLHENVYDHIDFVAKYSGLAIPIRNFNKVYNIAVWDPDGRVSSVKELLGKKFGSKIQKGVVEQVLRDLQMPREKNSGFFSAARGKWIGAIFWGNLSSMLKQTTSYWTASSYLSESSLVKGLSEYMRHTKTTRSEISEYTGTLYKRAQGLSTTELGERAERKRLAGASNKMTKAINQYAPWLKNIPEGLRPGNWLQAMDCTVATALWEACKIEVRDKMGISADNPEYMTMVTDLYDKVVEETQSNYDTLHRPEALKTTNELTKTLTMFQTDNLQQTGLIYDAYANMKNKSDAYKKNGSAENKKSYDDAKKQFGKVVKARVYSTIWLSMVTMLGAMALRKFLPYKDEEENDITAGSVAHRSLINMAEDMFCTLIPVGGNLILNIADAFVNGYDFLSEPAFDSLQNFIDTSAKLTKAFVSDEEGPEKQAKIDKAWSKFIVAAGNVTGIPVNNFTNLYNGVKGYALDITKGDFAHDISGYSSSKALYTYGDLAACLTTGDIQLEEKILNYYSNNGKSLTKASLTKEIKPAYVELYADDPNKGKLLQSKLIKKYGYDEDTIEKWPLAVLVDAIQSGDEELQKKIRKAFPGISESEVKKEIEKRQKSKENSKIIPKE